MYDTGKIIVGLVVFVILATSPLWFNALTEAGPEAPKVVYPTNGSTECVEAKDYMVPNHMDLLNQWRDDVVRRGERDYISSSNGKTYDMEMPGVPQLSPVEITNIINYIHHAWGNELRTVQLEEVREELKTCQER